MPESTFHEMLRRLDIVFVIDTTGSMGPCIAEVRKKLNHLASSVSGASVRPDVAFGVVAYRDHPPQEPSYVTCVNPIVSDLAAVQRTISGLTAEGGGDEPEAVMDGLWDALQKSQWRQGSQRVILLVGDAPAHDPCKCELTFPRIYAEAKKQDVRIFALGTSGSPQMIRQFKQVAEKTGGLFAKLDDAASLIEKILALLESSVIVDMEVSLAVYNRRMSGMAPAGIARQIGRSETEVLAIIRQLEQKGAKWPADAADAPFAPTTGAAPMVISGVLPWGGNAAGGSMGTARPIMVPIMNYTASSTFPVRWMGWQGARGYELQEARDGTFAKPQAVYSGPELSWLAEGKPSGAYYYRARLESADGSWSEWSEVQQTVVA
jgi:Mg-chelatase subunit ChlD